MVKTQLLLASKNYHTKCIKLLIQNNANSMGNKPFLIVYRRGHIDCVKLLIKHYAYKYKIYL